MKCRSLHGDRLSGSVAVNRERWLREAAATDGSYVSDSGVEIEATGLLNVVFCSPVAGSVRVTGADRLLSAVQNPVEGVGFEQIQGATSDQQIASGAAIQSIASGSAIQSVVTESSEDAVIAIATAEEVAT